MKNFYCLVLIFFFTSSIMAQEALWKMGNSFIAVFDDQKSNLLYSASCQKVSCDAINLTKNVSWKMLSKDATIGGKNPGAVLCKDVLKQKILYLKDMQGNENTFCVFKDKSFISSSSLSILADRNLKKDQK